LVFMTANRPLWASESVAEASELYRQGSAAYERGDFRIAGLAFEAACAAAPHSQTALGAALAWEAANDQPRAADNYALALRLEGLSDEQAAEAEAALASLRSRVGLLSIRAPTGFVVSVGHVVSRRAPAEVHLASGGHVVTFIGPDGATTRDRVEIAPGTTRSIVYAPESASGPTGGERGVPPALAGGRPADPTLPVAMGIGALGVAAAATAAASVLGAETLATKDAYEESGFRDRALYDDGVTLRTWTNVALIGAVAFAIAGTILLVTAPSGVDEPAALERAGVVAGPDGLGWTFR
jgi:hypothetical protein